MERKLQQIKRAIKYAQTVFNEACDCGKCEPCRSKQLTTALRNVNDLIGMLRMQELEKLFAAEEISIANGATPQLDDTGNVIVDMATCGTCRMSWNDALITSWTPAPSGRCPYEYIHAEIAELQRLRKRYRVTK